MEPQDDVDLSRISYLFPHLPSAVFSSFANNEVDISMGNNFLGEHPNGGQGQNSIGDLRAYESYYGNGWVIAGTHPSLSSVEHCIGNNAVHLARIHKVEFQPELFPSA